MRAALFLALMAVAGCAQVPLPDQPQRCIGYAAALHASMLDPDSSTKREIATHSRVLGALAACDGPEWTDAATAWDAGRT